VIDEHVAPRRRPVDRRQVDRFEAYVRGSTEAQAPAEVERVAEAVVGRQVGLIQFGGQVDYATYATNCIRADRSYSAGLM
jgi:hypothetical protein